MRETISDYKHNNFLSFYSNVSEENGLTQSIEESGYTSGDSSSDDEITFISNENDEDNTGLAGIHFKRDR